MQAPRSTRATAPFLFGRPLLRCGRVPLLLSVLASTAASAQVQPGWVPEGAFLQVGAGERVEAMTTGLTWPWRWTAQGGGGRFSGYWEASFSRWLVEAPHARQGQFNQVALTPVFRWRPGKGASPWFAEGGVGLTHLSSRYHNGGKHFSTRFNFGDHLAVGRSFGPRQRQEWLLRVQHFSNGSLRRPNPGEDFVQLRYAVQFD